MTVKKILPLLLSIMILPGLVACGQKKDVSETAQNSQVSEGGSEAQESDASQTSDTAPTNDAAQAAGTSEHLNFAGAADTMSPSDVLPLEEQRRILEENRSQWTFDKEDYTPDWYYAFTDLNHNGLLEVLSASTQGSGMYTYVYFYEVLPDGSGIKNLYQGSGIEGGDDWPEVIVESIPCCYDSASDSYYYLFTNTTRDGMAHHITQTVALCMKDGTATLECIAAVDVQYEEDSEKAVYTDGNGNSITKEEFDNAIKKRFDGLEMSEYKPEWFSGSQK